jgi:hypothetical protein
MENWNDWRTNPVTDLWMIEVLMLMEADDDDDDDNHSKRLVNYLDLTDAAIMVIAMVMEMIVYWLMIYEMSMVAVVVVEMDMNFELNL